MREAERFAENEPYLEWTDEEAGPYEDFIPAAVSLFHKAHNALKEGKVNLARSAYQKLFEVCDYEDDYGMGLQFSALTSLHHAQVKALYLRSIYETEPIEQSAKPTRHRYYRWATQDECFEQVGSIYSAQGFEFDHVGVIFGEDLVWRKERWVADLTKNKDDVFKRDLKRSGEDPVEKLRSVYRVLLTRGMQSTSVFVLDAETRAHFQECLATGKAAAVC